MIYVPDIDSYSCFTILNENVIRAYLTEPILNNNISFRDYYINSNYMFSDGIELIETVPVCINSNVLTNQVYYRNDFDKILIIFILLAFVCFYLPLKLILKLFKKRS